MAEGAVGGGRGGGRSPGNPSIVEGQSWRPIPRETDLIPAPPGGQGCRAVGMTGTSMRWQTGFPGRWAARQEGQNGARRGATSQWSRAEEVGSRLPKEGSHWPEEDRVSEREPEKRRVVRSGGDSYPGSEGPRGRLALAGVRQGLSLRWSASSGQLPLSSVTIC